MVTKINLSRDSGWTDYFVKYRVIINSKEIDKIANGKNVQLEVMPGRVEIFLRGQWYEKSNKLIFEAKNNQTVSLKCKSNLRGLKVILGLFYAIFLSHKWIVLEFENDEETP